MVLLGPVKDRETATDAGAELAGGATAAVHQRGRRGGWQRQQGGSSQVAANDNNNDDDGEKGTKATQLARGGRDSHCLFLMFPRHKIFATDTRPTTTDNNNNNNQTRRRSL